MSTPRTQTAMLPLLLLAALQLGGYLVSAAVLINGDAKVITPDIMVGNTSVIHIIDAVLIPPSLAEGSGGTMPGRRLLQEGDTILAVAEGLGLTTLVAAIKADPALLKKATDPSATITLFAPTNEAFEATFEELGITAADLLADTELLNAVLSYHVVGRAFSRISTVNDASVDTLLESDNAMLGPWATVQIATDAEGVSTVNGAEVIEPDIPAGANAYIDIIDMVLLPPLSTAPAIVSAAEGPMENYTMNFTMNVTMASESYNMTTNSSSTMNSSLANEFIDMFGDEDEDEMMMTGYDDSSYEMNETTGYDDSSYEMNDTTPTIASVAEGIPELSTLMAVVMKSPVVLAAATDPTTMVTVFAPTDEAFAAALEALGMTAEELLADEQLLTMVLSYHVVPEVIYSTNIAGTMELPTLLEGAFLEVEEV